MSDLTILGVGGPSAPAGLTGPPVFESGSDATQVTAASITWSHTAGGSNRGAVAFASQFTNNTADGACTYDGVSMLHVDRVESGAQGESVEMFVKSNPSSGSEVSVVYTPSGGSKDLNAVVASYTNCNQTSDAAMVGTPAQADDASAGYNVSSATDELVVSGAYQYNASNLRPTAASGGIQRIQATGSTEVVELADWADDLGATVAVDWQGSNISGSIGVSLITS